MGDHSLMRLLLEQYQLEVDELLNLKLK
ncbi:hypothetical protein A2U01_0106564, partial [Trifolium medium]|nr:hypothetical protein [Trifolium medium]